VRGVIVRGITLAGTLRRAAAPQDPRASAPRRVRVLRRPRAALPAPLLPPPLLARLLAARRHRRPAAATRPAFLNQGDIHFTPEAFPQTQPQGLRGSQYAAQGLRSQDPGVGGFQHINQVLSPEAGITDPAAMFANLWRRISTALADTNVDASLSTTPQAVPATPADAAPDAPVASPHPPTPPTGPSAKHAPRVSAGVVSGPTASDQRAAQPPPPLAGGSSREADRCREADRWGEGAGGFGRSFRSFTQSFARRRPHHVRRCREFVHPRGVRDGLQCLPSPPRLCHAACTGPP